MIGFTCLQSEKLMKGYVYKYMKRLQDIYTYEIMYINGFAIASCKVGVICHRVAP